MNTKAERDEWRANHSGMQRCGWGLTRGWAYTSEEKDTIQKMVDTLIGSYGIELVIQLCLPPSTTKMRRQKNSTALQLKTISVWKQLGPSH